jgi:hypothetical protein
MSHSLHTVVIDHRGNLAANLEGNEFTADQLGDLLQSVLDREPVLSARNVQSKKRRSTAEKDIRGISD